MLIKYMCTMIAISVDTNATHVIFTGKWLFISVISGRIANFKQKRYANNIN